MGERQLVREGDAEFFVEVSGDGGGPQTVALDQAISFGRGYFRMG